MIKIIPPGSWDFGERIADLVKVASTGLRGNDLTDFVKRAGHRFAHEIKNMSFQDGDVPIHVIALGDTETIGPNRNGDGFGRETCRRDHGTFVKLGRFFRSHLNKDKSKSYGLIKSSYYNEDMGRIELLVLLNGNEKAAKRNGGLLADKEMEKLASGNDLAVSMSTKVSHDVCSSCHNKARTRAEYCKGIDEGGKCPHGGLMHKMGRVCEDGHILFADNPFNNWFDISNVFRPADRTAYCLGKVASFEPLGGAKLAEEMAVSAPFSLLLEDDDILVSRQAKTIDKLASLERTLQPSNLDLAVGTYSTVIPPATLSVKEAFAALHRNNILLPIAAFLSVMAGKEVSGAAIEKTAEYLPNIFHALQELPDLEERLAGNNFLIDPVRYVSKEASNWSDTLLHYSVDTARINDRIQRKSLYVQPESLLRRPMWKQASASNAYDELALSYALYQTAFLSQRPANSRIFEYAVSQNRVL